jgi:hypothetical protein
MWTESLEVDSGGLGGCQDLLRTRRDRGDTIQLTIDAADPDRLARVLGQGNGYRM